MRIIVSNNIRIQNPTLRMINWVKEELKVPNKEYERRVRMNKWLGNTSPYIFLYEWRAGELVLPYGALDMIPLSISGEAETVDYEFPKRHHVDFGGSVPLYDYQQDALTECCLAEGGILQSPAGSGKTQIGIALAMTLGLRTLWLTHTADLLAQSKERAMRYMDDDLIGTITAGKVNIGKGITFATVQTMSKMNLAEYRDFWDVVIVDECFPAGTLISTPGGRKAIETLHKGDEVYCWDHEHNKLTTQPIEELMTIKRHNRLVRVKTHHGREFICTENHPVYVANIGDYKEAIKLERGDELRGLREELRPGYMEQIAKKSYTEGSNEGVLFDRVFNEGTKEALPIGGSPCQIGSISCGIQSQVRFCPYEGSQSNAQSGNSTEGVGDTACYRPQASCERWERSGDDCATANCERLGVGLRCCGRTGYTDKNPSRERVPDLLQSGCRDTEVSDSDRNRRSFSRLPCETGTGSKEIGITDGDWVDSIEILESGYSGADGGVQEHDTVYNISVRTHHNYFAEGILVHNCHRVAGTPTAMTMFSTVLSSLRARYKYGLSATVHRADGMIKATYALLGKVFYEVPPEGVADKIMPVKVEAVSTGLGMSMECLGPDGMLDYAKLINYLVENEDRNKLIMSLLKREPDKSWLILTDRVEHSGNLIEMLPNALKPYAVTINGRMTSKTGRAQREKALDLMRSGEKRFLFATYRLAKEGLDIPRLDRLVLATPQRDYAVIVQSVGRIARTFPGKKDPVCYDLVDNGIPYLIKSFKQRCTSYRKAGCII